MTRPENTDEALDAIVDALVREAERQRATSKDVQRRSHRDSAALTAFDDGAGVNPPDKRRGPAG